MKIYIFLKNKYQNWCLLIKNWNIISCKICQKNVIVAQYSKHINFYLNIKIKNFKFFLIWHIEKNKKEKKKEKKKIDSLLVDESSSLNDWNCLELSGIRSTSDS